MLNNENFGIKYEISNVFKMMIELNSRDESFLIDILYNKSFIPLLEYLLKPVDQNKRNDISITKQIIIEIFIYLFSQNNFDEQFWLNDNQLETIVLKLLEDNNKIINLYTIKLLKCVIDYTDISSCKLFFTKELCDRLIQLFKDNIKNNNIIISCIYDFFEALNNKKDVLFNLIINHERDFFCESEYKIFFKNVVGRIENKPKGEKYLIHYMKMSLYKDLDFNKSKDTQEGEEKQNDEYEDEQLFNNNNINDANEEPNFLEKKRKRFFGIENNYDDTCYINEESNEYEESESFKKQRKKSYSVFDEDEAESDFEKIYENIVNNENSINLKENEEMNSDKSIK
jgi:hypothetical protein